MIYTNTKGKKVVCVCARVRACVRVRACKGGGTIIFDSNCSDNKEYRMTMQALQRQNVLGYHAPDILKLRDLTGRFNHLSCHLSSFPTTSLRKMSFAKYSDAIKEGDTVMVYEVSTYLCVNCVQHNMHAHTHTHVPLFFFFSSHMFFGILKFLFRYRIRLLMQGVRAGMIKP